MSVHWSLLRPRLASAELLTSNCVNASKHRSSHPATSGNLQFTSSLWRQIIVFVLSSMDRHRGRRQTIVVNSWTLSATQEKHSTNLPVTIYQFIFIYYTWVKITPTKYNMQKTLCFIFVIQNKKAFPATTHMATMILVEEYKILRLITFCK